MYLTFYPAELIVHAGLATVQSTCHHLFSLVGNLVLYLVECL